MANSTTPFGLQPARPLGTGVPNFSINKGLIAYNNSHTFGEGDVVYLLSTGYIDVATASTNPNLGIFTYCNYANPANTIQPGNTRIWNAPTLASTTAVTAYYWDDPTIVFRVRANGSVPQSSIGMNANFSNNGAPNSLTGISTLALDTSTIATTNTLPLRIVGFAADANNDPTTANPVLEVVLNTSVYKTTTGV